MTALALDIANSTDDLSKVSAKWRVKVDTWIREFERLANGLTSKNEIARVMGCNISSVNRKLKAFRQHGALGLAPAYKGPKALPDEFADYWKTLCEEYQRCTAGAWKELVRRWRAKEAIAGYAGHPGWPNLPRGWGKDGRNLYRHQPSKLSLAALRHGLGRAIAMHAPKTLSTRVGLWHLSHIIYDDVKLDVKSHILTSSKLLAALQIGALDLLSADRFTHGTKPQLWRADGTKASLVEGDMRFAFANQLYNFGISQRGSTIVIEHGTATLRGPIIDICKRYLGDKITFELSGMTGKMQAIAGMGDGKGGGGNFRHKAALESLHNLIHNELSALPGQTGHDRDEPEFLGVLQREHEQLMRIIETLPPDMRQMLKHGTFEFHTQLVPIVNTILDRINKRTDHNLEGWAECGFLSRDYRLLPESAEWINEGRLLELPAAARAAYMAMAEADARCMEVRKLSPHEVFTRGAQSGEVLRVPIGMIAEILYQDLARPRKCADSLFTFEDQEMGPGVFQYESRIVRPDGREEELTDRETYDTVVNPFDPSVMWVFSAVRQRGSFLGIAKRDMRACRADREATERKWGRAKQRLSDQLENTRNRNTHRTRAATERASHNAGVISKARQNQRESTARATAALNAALPGNYDNNTNNNGPKKRNNNSHETTVTQRLPHQLW